MILVDFRPHTRLRSSATPVELVTPERPMINPDCGLRNLPTAIASAKLRAMVVGAAAVRDRLDGAAPLPVPHRPAG